MSEQAVSWERVSGLGMIGLRGDFAELGGAISDACGLPVPGVRRIEIAGPRRLAWMSPDELLLFAPSAEIEGLLAALSEGLAGTHHSVVDLSDARAIFALTGPGAREALAKGAPVDLAPSAFGPGDFRRTRLGQVAAAFGQVSGGQVSGGQIAGGQGSEEAERFELICFRSLAGHMSDWLDLACRAGSLPGILFRAAG